MQLFDTFGVRQKKGRTNLLVHVPLVVMAGIYNYRHSLRKYLASDEGWLNFSVGIRTENGSVQHSISFQNGTVWT
jgi:hypothetical protein